MDAPGFRRRNGVAAFVRECLQRYECACVPAVPPSISSVVIPNAARIADPLHTRNPLRRGQKLWPERAGGDYFVFTAKEVSTYCRLPTRLPAPALLLAGGVLRQPHLTSPRAAGKCPQRLPGDESRRRPPDPGNLPNFERVCLRPLMTITNTIHIFRCRC